MPKDSQVFKFRYLNVILIVENGLYFIENFTGSIQTLNIGNSLGNSDKLKISPKFLSGLSKFNHLHQVKNFYEFS